MDSKGTSLLGSGATLMPTPKSSFKSIHTSICANARASVVEKQFGADPTLPGPGQYINPITDGRNANGEVKALLSTQKSQPSVKFAGSSPPVRDNSRSMAKPNSAKEPGPGQYIDPLKFGRGSDGEYKAVTSNEAGSRSTVWFRKGASRDVFNAGSVKVPGPGAYINPMTMDRGADGEVKPVQSNQRGTHGVKMGRPRSACDALRKPASLAISRRTDDTPGPGHYINPLKEGRNSDGEIKALLSNQQSVRTVKFGGRPSSANSRSMAKPNSAKEPGPGQYIDPMKEGRGDNGEVRAILSTQKGTAGVVFAREPYSTGISKNSARPQSAPSRSRHGAGAGLIVLDGDEKILSKYRNSGGAKWGPPGR